MTSPTRRPRLAVEPLERRDTPATFTWDGGSGVSNNWSDAANWVNDTLPALDGTADLVFPDGAARPANTNDFAVGTPFNSLSFTGSGYALGGNAVTLGSAVPATAGVSAAANATGNTIGFGLTLGGAAAETFTLDTGAVLTVTGRVDGAAGVQLVKAGAGTLVLTADNSGFAGPVAINQGVLRAQTSAFALGSAAAGTTVAAGAQLQVQSLTGTAAEPITLDGAGPAGGGAIQNVAGDNTLSGAITLSGTATIESVANFLTLSGVISGPGGVTKTGAGGVQFAGAAGNTYAGPTTVSAGRLNLLKAAGDAVPAGGLAVSGTGVVSLFASNQIADAATVRVSDGAFLNLNNNDETVGPLFLGDGATVQTLAGTLRLAGDVTREVGTTPATAFITGRLDLNGGPRTITVADAGALGVELDVSAQVVDDAGGGGLVKAGAGLLQFSGTAANTYTGTTAVTGGVLSLQKTGVVAVNGPLTVGGAGAAARLFAAAQVADAAPVTVTAGGTFDVNGFAETVGPVTVTGGSLGLGGASVLTVGGPLTVTGGSSAGGRIVLNGNVTIGASATPTVLASMIDLNGATRTFDVADGAAADDLTVQGAILGGAFGLTKTGAGTLVLTQANTYTGTTTVAAGVLRVNGNQAGSPVTLTGGTLGGSGTVGPVTATGGTITPGLVTPPVALTAAGGLSLSGATFAPVLTDSLGGVSDRLTVNGAVDLTGATLAATRIGTPVTNRQFLLIANDGTDPVVGTFTGLPEGAKLLVNGVEFAITYAGNDGNDVLLNPTGGGTLPPPPTGPVQNLAVGGPATGVARVLTPGANGAYSASAVATLSPFGDVAASVRTAVADVDGDGTPDTVFVTGPGTPLRVTVVSGKDNSTVLVAPFDPFGGDFTGGGFVAAGDFDKDGRAEFVVTPDQGGGPRVSIYSLTAGAVTRRANFLGIDDASFRGGARAAAGDVNKDGTPDLVVAAGFGGGPRTALFDGRTALATPTRLIGDFFAFPGNDATTLRNGVFVAAGDVDGDGFADLIFGGGPGGAPRVFILSGVVVAAGNVGAAQAAPVANFFVANNTADRGGVRVAVTSADGDARADVAAGSGEGSPSNIRIYLGKNFTSAAEPGVFQDINPFGATLPGGVFVG